MNQNLPNLLRELRLSGAKETLEIRLQEARAANLTHDEFLELLLQDERSIRKQRKMQRMLKKADFKEQKTIDEFDFSFKKIFQERIFIILLLVNLFDKRKVC